MVVFGWMDDHANVLYFMYRSILANVLWCIKINQDKASGKYDRYVGAGDDRDPAFKMIL